MRLPAPVRRVLAVGSLSAALVSAATGFAAPASAGDVTVPGCFGVLVIYCNPTVEYVLPYSVGTQTTTIPVCAGTCTDVDVPVPTLSTTTSPRLCVTAQDRNGNTNLNECIPLAISVPGVPRVYECPSYYGETGYYVEDDNGNTILNGCVYTGNVPDPAVRLITCNDGTRGVRLYDRNGSFSYESCDLLSFQL